MRRQRDSFAAPHFKKVRADGTCASLPPTGGDWAAEGVAPFTVKTGTASAFVTTKEDPEINQPTIDYVATFVPDATGKKFNPHVTIGLASQDYLKKMLDAKFEAFTSSPTGAAVYHLGNFGTAREKLKSWEFKPAAGSRALR